MDVGSTYNVKMNLPVELARYLLLRDVKVFASGDGKPICFGMV
jgi:hypothetical protein